MLTSPSYVYQQNFITAQKLHFQFFRRVLSYVPNNKSTSVITEKYNITLSLFIQMFLVSKM